MTSSQPFIHTLALHVPVCGEFECLRVLTSQPFTETMCLRVCDSAAISHTFPLAHVTHMFSFYDQACLICFHGCASAWLNLSTLQPLSILVPPMETVSNYSFLLFYDSYSMGLLFIFRGRSNLSVSDCNVTAVCVAPQVEEVKKHNHCLAFSSAGPQSQTYYVSFDSFTEHLRWHRHAAKVLCAQRTRVSERKRRT